MRGTIEISEREELVGEVREHDPGTLHFAPLRDPAEVSDKIHLKNLVLRTTSGTQTVIVDASLLKESGVLVLLI